MYQKKLGIKGDNKNYGKLAKNMGFDDDLFSFLDNISKKVNKIKKIININRIIKALKMKMKMNLIKIKTNYHMIKMIMIFNNRWNNNMIILYLSKISQQNNNLQSNNNQES